MASVADRQEFTFQAEIKQLLQLLSHSLYQSKEIAVRELVSNASDALDKMRFAAMTDDAARGHADGLEIDVKGDKDRHELIIRDNGIGMTRDELVENLGTIAHSGSMQFLKNMAASGGKPDASLIGQFGVGFYSAFMLADKVRVRTRSYREETGWEWESDGSGTFTVEPAAVPTRGTEVILHLKDDAHDLAEDYRIKHVLKTYSGFVPHPIRVDGTVVNDQKPIWVEPKGKITEEQHTGFFQYLTHNVGESPLWHLHFNVDSPMQFRALLYCPKTNVERLGFGRAEHGVNLCAKRILVQSDNRDLLPEYLRFLYGLVDSEDLPLNVSRETLQDSRVIQRIKTVLVKGVLDKLTSMATDAPEDYLAFYAQFGPALKEGVAIDFGNRERIAKLLRFPSSDTAAPQPTGLDAYISRAQADQKDIYFLSGPDAASIRKNPNLEIFRKRNLEVLLLTDPLDEFVVNSLHTFDGRNLVSIDSADLNLPGEPEKTADKPDEAPPAADFARVLDLFREALGDRVESVRASKRLTDSPACLVNADGGLSAQLRHLLKANNQNIPEAKKILEINPDAALIRRLVTLAANPSNANFVRQCGLQLWANTMILEGEAAEPEEMVARVQSLMEQAAASMTSIIV